MQDSDFFDFLKDMYKLFKKEVFNPETFWDKPFQTQKVLWEYYKRWRDEF